MSAPAIDAHRDRREGPSAPPLDEAGGLLRLIEIQLWLILLPTLGLLALGTMIITLGGVDLGPVLGLVGLSLIACQVIGASLSLAMFSEHRRLSRLRLDFVSRLGHDLRTPLTSITLFAENLLSGPGLDDQQRECAMRIAGEARRLTASVTRLLDWSRLERGRRRFVMRHVLAEDVVGRAVDLIEAVVNDRHQQLDIVARTDNPSFIGDEEAVLEAVLNLLDNASKFSPDGSTIRVELEATGNRVLIRVIDQGPGIPRREQRRVFGSFYRLDTRLAGSTPGSGLGLNIVSSIVRAHRGRVRLEAPAAGGCRFTIELPRAPTAANRAHQVEGNHLQPNDAR